MDVLLLLLLHLLPVLMKSSNRCWRPPRLLPLI
jgi:hypothetical protein